MKLTARLLRRLISEEVSRLYEEDTPKDAAAAAKGEKTDTKGQLNTKDIAAQLKIDEPTLKAAMTAAKKGDATKGKELLAFAKALLAADPTASKNVGILFAKVQEK